MQIMRRRDTTDWTSSPHLVPYLLMHKRTEQRGQRVALQCAHTQKGAV